MSRSTVAWIRTLVLWLIPAALPLVGLLVLTQLGSGTQLFDARASGLPMDLVAVAILWPAFVTSVGHQPLLDVYLFSTFYYYLLFFPYLRYRALRNRQPDTANGRWLLKVFIWFTGANCFIAGLVALLVVAKCQM